MITYIHYHYSEEEKAPIASYKYGLLTGEWWMPELPTRQGIFDMHGVVFYEPSMNNSSSPN